MAAPAYRAAGGPLLCCCNRRSVMDYLYYMTKEERWVLEEKYHGDTDAPGFAEDRKRLACGEPLAYVIGWQPFLGLRISLDSRPLIPRPETEWWTEQLLRKAQKGGERAPEAFLPTLHHSSPVSRKGVPAKGISQTDEPRGGDFLAKKYAAPFEKTPDAKPVFSFLDLCAGSGAIGCAALAQIPHAQVFFGELDPVHELTIRGNIRGNGLDAACADIRIGDLFAPFGDVRFDRIAANPPYIPKGRILPESVARYEPARALYAGTDGLDLVRPIVAQLPDRLAPGGEAWIEIDHTQAEAARSLARETGLSGTMINDQYGVPRVLVVSFS